jgi:hypothetical protein
MVQKISLVACLFVWFIGACGERYIECDKNETIYLSLADTNWAPNAQLGNFQTAWVSSASFSQSAIQFKKKSYNYYSSTNEVKPPVKIDVDKCRTYYAYPLEFGFSPSIYPVSISFGILHNPFTKTLQLQVKQEDVVLDYTNDNQFYEEVSFSILDSSLSTISKLNRYNSYYETPTLYYSKATFLPSFKGVSGRTFSSVYKIPLEAFRIVKVKANAIRQVWIAKEVGIVQYEMGDGLIWSMK